MQKRCPRESKDPGSRDGNTRDGNTRDARLGFHASPGAGRDCRVLQPIANNWTLLSYLDIGGFGVGSDFTWQALVGMNYEFSKTFAAKFGYRYLSVDFDKDGFVYDMANSGLYFGLGIRF